MTTQGSSLLGVPANFNRRGARAEWAKAIESAEAEVQESHRHMNTARDAIAAAALEPAADACEMGQVTWEAVDAAIRHAEMGKQVLRDAANTVVDATLSFEAEEKKLRMVIRELKEREKGLSDEKQALADQLSRAQGGDNRVLHGGGDVHGMAPAMRMSREGLYTVQQCMEELDA